MDSSSARVDILDSQACDLAHSEPGGIENEGDGSVLGRPEFLGEPPRLLLAKDLRQLLLAFRPWNGGHRRRRVQDLPMKEPEGAQSLVGIAA
jgi:hypothetical protein